MYMYPMSTVFIGICYVVFLREKNYKYIHILYFLFRFKSERFAILPFVQEMPSTIHWCNYISTICKRKQFVVCSHKNIAAKKCIPSFDRYRKKIGLFCLKLLPVLRTGNLFGKAVQLLRTFHWRMNTAQLQQWAKAKPKLMKSTFMILKEI